MIGFGKKDKKSAQDAVVRLDIQDSLQPAPSNEVRSQSSASVRPQQNEIKHGIFKIDGVRGPPKRFVLVPHGRELGPKDWQKILKAWDTPAPNLLIQLKSNLGHPKEIVTKEFASCGELQTLVSRVEAIKQGTAGSTPRVATQEVQGEQPAMNEEQFHFANEVLHKKLKTFVGSLAAASQQTNSWLLVAAEPIQGEILLEQASADSATYPFVLSLDYIDRAMMDDVYAPAKRFTSAMLQELSLSSVALGSEKQPMLAWLSGDLWNPEVNTSNKHFVEMSKTNRDIFDWKFKGLDDPRAVGHPYLSGPFRGATHYVFFQGLDPNAEHDDAAGQAGSVPALEMASKLEDMAHTSSVAPLGLVYIGGGAVNLRHMVNSMSRGKPLVMVHNAGGASHQCALVLEQLLTLAGKSEEEIGPTVFEAVRGKFPASLMNVDPPLIWQIMDLWLANPELFKEAVTVVNPLAQSAEDMLQAVSRCFASQASLGAQELGAGTAQAEVVLEAWGLHAQLQSNGKQKKQMADALVLAALGLAFASTLVAAVHSFLDTDAAAPLLEKLPDKVVTAVDALCLLLPALSGLAATATTQLQLHSKSSALKMAAAQVVNEIYEFRTRTGRYNAIKLSQSQPQEGGDAAEDAATMSRRLRMQFANNVQGIMASVMATEVKTDHMEMSGSHTFAKNSDSLRKHIETSVFRGRKDVLPVAGSLSEHAGQYVPLLVTAEHGADVDDFVSSISTEAYVKFRLEPMHRLFSAQAPRLSRQLKAFQIAIIVLATAGTLLAALKLQVWIPVSVALGNALHAKMQSNGLIPHLQATNLGIMSMRNLLIYWRGLGLMERRMPHVRERVVRTLEAASLAEVASSLDGSGVLLSWKDSQQGDEQSLENLEQKKMSKQSDSPPQ
eukprot:TRINITY_DN37305_c0_g1_i1.p1 TRINITY_DN37305_c0_g1~~TRINITY_DN37305_c0_g1_i1.p1  ORF type:complete len:893 (-),score=177.76 TRINITY_DN37305_c0_g1_i1:68-2746(-)